MLALAGAQLQLDLEHKLHHRVNLALRLGGLAICTYHDSYWPPAVEGTCM